jgi:hypothetical protein
MPNLELKQKESNKRTEEREKSTSGHLTSITLQVETDVILNIR